MIWVINSNSNTCRIYEYNKHKSSLGLLKEILHPENRLHNIDLVADRPGRYQAGAAHGSYSPSSDPKDIKIDTFLRDCSSF